MRDERKEIRDLRDATKLVEKTLLTVENVK